jgi:periplasmic protein TonB
MSVLENKDNSDRKEPAGSQPLQAQDPSAVIKFSKESPVRGIPTFGAGYGIYETRPENFVLSFLTHAALVAVVIWLYHVTIQQIKPATKNDSVTMLAPYLPMTPSKKAGGGGGGGENSKLQASMGGPPKMSKAPQLAPPVVIRPKEESKLMAEPTVVADLKLPQAPQIGDQLSKLVTPSSGTGIGSGVGSGSGGGFGSGHGRGYGPGNGYGSGGGDGGYGGLTQPKLIYSPDPEFSEEARKAKYQGVVVLKVLVGTDGRVHDAHVARSLGMGLDEKALETVRLWKFEPARAKDGKAVDVYASIEVNFRLY